MGVKENRALLVKALRSGRYMQGMGRLKKTDNSYCCLGVACEVARKNGLDLKIGKIGVSTYNYSSGNEKAYLDLSISAIRKFYGFKSTNGAIKSKFRDKVTKYLESKGYDMSSTNTSQMNLVHFNDALGVKFKHIADIIEMGAVQ